MFGWAVVVLVLSGAGCPRSSASRAERPSLESRAGASQAVVDAPAAEPPAEPRQTAPPVRLHGLTIVAARRYMLQLINRDRASMGLAPVTLDEGPATRAGQAHADDMAKHGYLGHWGSDGSVPEERFTEAGGADMVLENASCFTDERPRPLDPSPTIDPRSVELTEDMFFHEQPPHDGHRKNILKPFHKRVGIGVAQPTATPTEIPAPCFAQEFVDPYGTYGRLPKVVSPGQILHVEGAVSVPAKFAGVGMSRVELPAPIPVDVLNRRRTYPVPTPYVMYWPAGYKTPIEVRESPGGRFAVDVPVGDGGKPGLYGVSVWASLPGSEELVMVSLRTIRATVPR